jgi:hypothetical protein
MEIASSASPPRNDKVVNRYDLLTFQKVVGRYDLLTFQNTGAGPFSGALMPLLHAARGK